MGSGAELVAAVEYASWRTQGRWLELAGRLTGVSPELEEREREQIATRLGVATMTVLAGRAAGSVVGRAAEPR